MVDRYSNFSDTPGSAATTCFAIIPHDTNALTQVPKAVYVGTGGHVTLRATNDSAATTFRNVASGQILDIRASHVLATGTTATDLVALA